MKLKWYSVVFALAFFAILGFNPNTASASEKSIDDIYKDMPKAMVESFKKNLEDKGISSDDLITKKDIYYEVILKDENEQSKIPFNVPSEEVKVNYDFIERTKEDYDRELEKEKKENSLIDTLGVSHVDKPVANSWMRLTLTVYTTGDRNKYEATSFWEWLRSPFFELTDANNIHYSSKLTYDPKSISSFYAYETSMRDHQYTATTTVTKNPLGLNQIIDLQAYGYYHYGYLTSILQFSQPTVNAIGDIYTEYGHAEVALSPGFDSTGAISFGVSLKTDIASGPAGQVKNY